MQEAAIMNRCGRWKPVAAMIAVDFGLAVVNILLKKVLNEGMNHLVIITYRQTVSAIFLTPIAYILEGKTRPKLTTHISCGLFLSALVGGTLAQYFFLLGLQRTSATFVSAFINMVPVNTFIMALPLGLEKLNMKGKDGRAKALGTMVCAGGTLLLTLYKGMALIRKAEVGEADHGTQAQRQSWSTGSIFLTAGSLLWSSWFLMQSRIGQTYPFQYSSTAIMSFFGGVQSAILCAILHRANFSTWMVKGTLEISTVIFAGTVGSGLCYVLISWCVKQRGPVFSAAFSPFVQVFVAVYEVCILRQQIHLGSVLGSILVITGMYILLWGKSKETNHPDQMKPETAEENPDCDPATSEAVVHPRKDSLNLT